MDYRTNIVNAAKDWADPGEWRPDADTLVNFFKYSGAEFWPTRDDAQKALDRGGVGVKVNGQSSIGAVFSHATSYVLREF